MTNELLAVEANEKIAKSVYKMTLSGDCSAITAPGQFVNFRLEGKFLRRPISVCDWEPDRLTVVYKVVGEGTQAMSGWARGKRVDTLVGLGNGFDCAAAGDAPLLVGGGVGAPPLYGLCRRLRAQGRRVQVILGFNTASEAFFLEEFATLGVSTMVTTADGSLGQRGFVTDAMHGLQYSYFYACGPIPMFRAMERVAVGGGEYSLEERMGCGFGACMGCTCKTAGGSKRICADGPVLKREEILWT
ncbi:MAG: dihydroorotate dehydrogenase electron transfer subunit [Firmicutes bacterium]|nr:dihydroorotate dehydrogenase electron transfer subunit [Bacillota bacterium]